LRERLLTDAFNTVVQQNRLSWYGHVSREDYNDWMKNVWIVSRGGKPQRWTINPGSCERKTVKPNKWTILILWTIVNRRN